MYVFKNENNLAEVIIRDGVKHICHRCKRKEEIYNSSVEFYVPLTGPNLSSLIKYYKILQKVLLNKKKINLLVIL